MAIKTSEVYRKRQILRYVEDNPASTAGDVSKGLGISIENAQMFLFRLFGAVLVSREKVKTSSSKKPTFAYNVSIRGLKRLEYWKAQESAARSEERPIEEKSLSAMPRRKRKRKLKE